MAKRHWNRAGDIESMLLHIEELVVANSGEDVFEEVFKLLVAKLWDERSGKRTRFHSRGSERETVEVVRKLLREAENAWPGILGTDLEPRLAPEHLRVCVGALARHAVGGANLQVFDGFFEYLVTKAAKGAKGQYFTPRHIIEFCVQVLRPKQAEIVCDPGCGSGGFLLHSLNYVQEHEQLSLTNAQQYCQGNLWGFDLDLRATRVANALMLIAGNESPNIIQLNSLIKPNTGNLFPRVLTDYAHHSVENMLCIEDVCRSQRRHHVGFDIILTNPPFAGEVRERHILDSYKSGLGRTRVERDILFLERCIQLLRPGGRMGIVLPHNKFASSAFAYMREQLSREARIMAVVGLGRNTFLPHTHQKANILFVRKRLKNEFPVASERVLFAISKKDGKNSKGQLVLRRDEARSEDIWKSVDHDLDEIVIILKEFIDASCTSISTKRSTLYSIRRVGETGKSIVLAPERYDPRRTCLPGTKESVTIASVAQVVQQTVNPNGQSDGEQYLVLDTSDAKEGVAMCRKKAVSRTEIGSTKKRVDRGCVIVSRLRPYLRQVAFIDAQLPGWTEDVQLLCSSEFFVLRSVDDRPIGFLVPLLLSSPIQSVLAASQEGGHHPRFNQATLMSLPIPETYLERRDADSEKVEEAVAMFRSYERLTGQLVDYAGNTFQFGSTYPQSTESI